MGRELTVVGKWGDFTPICGVKTAPTCEGGVGPFCMFLVGKMVICQFFQCNLIVYQ